MKDGFLRDVLDGRKYQTDLVLALVIALLGLVFALAMPDGSALRMLFGIAMLALIPGYSMVSALWPRARLTDSRQSVGSPGGADGIDHLERLALSFGLSIALLSLTGLALHFTSLGITLESTLAVNTGMILMFISIAFVRRARTPRGEVFRIGLDFKWEMPRKGTDILITGVIAASLITATVALAYSLTYPGAEEHYSSVFILDENRTAQDYPTNLNRSTPGTVIVGISCHEFATTNYTILTGVEGANERLDTENWTGTFLLDEEVLISRNVVLDHGASFEEAFTFRFDAPGTYRVVWAVEIDGNPTDYSAHLWVVVNAD